jgi:transposase
MGRVRLSRGERRSLEQIVRLQRVEARRYRRARMVLLAACGKSISAIARQLGTCRLRVSQWLKRFEQVRLSGLEDRPRSGRPIEITALERHQVIATACRAPKELGMARNTWTHESLREVLVGKGLVRRISASEVGRILGEADLKPHRVKGWCHSSDPDFQAKMRTIVALYVRRPAGAPVLSVDEKTGMQALSRARELQPAAPGRAGRLEFEYRRNGTRCLFACFNVGTGRVVGRITNSRKRPDFFAFLDLIARKYRQPRVHVILDNLNTHKDTSMGAFLSDWNRRHGSRFVFHFTPTHGSWLNQVELWFAIITRRVLRHGNFRSVDELNAALEQFITRWNRREAHPFRWSYRGLPLVS